MIGEKKDRIDIRKRKGKGRKERTLRKEKMSVFMPVFGGSKNWCYITFIGTS